MQLPAGRLPKLTELNMTSLKSQLLMQVVGHGVGQQLQTLRIIFCLGNYTALQLDKLLDACPYLSALCLDGKSLQSAGELLPDTCRQLRILRLSMEDRWEPWVQQGLLPQLLLLAHDLRSVELCSEFLAVQDLEPLTQLVEQRACLRYFGATSN